MTNMQEGSNPVFTVIIPLYNKENTIARCVESVLKQTFSDFELVVVNDGSRDNSLTILQQITDDRLRVLDHENYGVSYSRNRAILEAKGAYLVFIDADDYWAEDHLSIVYDHLKNNPAELYFTGLTRVEVDGTKKKLSFPYEGFVDKQQVLREFFGIESVSSLYGYLHNKIISRNLVMDYQLLLDEHLKMSEDLEFLMRCYDKAASFFFIQEWGYHYVQYPSGTTLFSANIDFVSLIDIQKKMLTWLDGYIKDGEVALLYSKMVGLARCAVLEIQPARISSLPKIAEALRNREDVYMRIQVQSTTDWVFGQLVHQRYCVLMLYVFVRQIYMKTRRLCRI